MSLIESIVFSYIFFSIIKYLEFNTIICSIIFGSLFFAPTSNEHLIEIALVFLMFTIGLHFNLSRIKQIWRDVLVIFLAQIIFISLFSFLINSYFLELDIFTNLLISLNSCITCSAVASRILSDSGELNFKRGQVAFCLMILQDLLTITILSFKKSGNFNFDILAKIISSIIIIYILIPYLKSYMKPDQVVISPLVFTLLLISILSYFSLPAEFAAFLSGMIFSRSPFRVILGKISENINDILMTLFFMHVGSIIVFYNFSSVISFSILMLLVRILTNFTFSYLILRDFFSCIKISCILASNSEFNFALTKDLNNNSSFLVNASTILSMIISPLIFYIFNFIFSQKELGIAMEAAHSDTLDISNHIIVIGYGKIGSSICSVIRSECIPNVIIDNKIDTVIKGKENNEQIYMMDTRFKETFKSLNVEKASLVVITTKNMTTTLRAIENIRSVSSSIEVAAIYYDKKSFELIRDKGAIPLSIELGIIGRPFGEYLIKKIQ